MEERCYAGTIGSAVTICPILKRYIKKLAFFFVDSFFLFTFASGVGRNPLWQKKRNAPNLRSGNVRNFQSKVDNDKRAGRLPRIAWGCIPILVIRLSHDLHFGTG